MRNCLSFASTSTILRPGLRYSAQSLRTPWLQIQSECRAAFRSLLRTRILALPVAIRHSESGSKRPAKHAKKIRHFLETRSIAMRSLASADAVPLHAPETLLRRTLGFGVQSRLQSGSIHDSQLWPRTFDDLLLKGKFMFTVPHL